MLEIPIELPRRVFPGKIRNLLCEERYWAQRAFARDALGDPCDGKGEDAVCWCLLEAIDCCYPAYEGDSIIYRIKQHLAHPDSIADWQDDPERTFAQIRALVEALDI